MTSSREEVQLGTRLDIVEHHLKHLMCDCADKANRLEVAELQKRITEVETELTDFAAVVTRELVKHATPMPKIHEGAHEAISEAVEKISEELQVRSLTVAVPPKCLDDTTSTSIASTASTGSSSEYLEMRGELKRLLEEARKDIDVIYSDLRVQMTASNHRFNKLENDLKTLRQGVADGLHSDDRGHSHGRSLSPSIHASQTPQPSLTSSMHKAADVVQQITPPVMATQNLNAERDNTLPQSESNIKRSLIQDLRDIKELAGKLSTAPRELPGSVPVPGPNCLRQWPSVGGSSSREPSAQSMTSRSRTDLDASARVVSCQSRAGPLPVACGGSVTRPRSAQQATTPRPSGVMQVTSSSGHVMSKPLDSQSPTICAVQLAAMLPRSMSEHRKMLQII